MVDPMSRFSRSRLVWQLSRIRRSLVPGDGPTPTLGGFALGIVSPHNDAEGYRDVIAPAAVQIPRRDHVSARKSGTQSKRAVCGQPEGKL